MALLEVPGAFTCPVPDGWSVSGVPGEHYVFRPPRGSGEVRLVVLDRGATPLVEAEGEQRIIELLGELGVDPDGEDVAVRLRATRAAHRGFAWFDAYDADGHDVDGFAGVVVWPGGLVAATAMARPREPAVVSTAELLVASIAPIVVSRRRDR